MIGVMMPGMRAPVIAVVMRAITAGAARTVVGHYDTAAGDAVIRGIIVIIRIVVIIWIVVPDAADEDAMTVESVAAVMEAMGAEATADRGRA